ncbi:hypothetical protein [Nocardia spumae]|uniref:hypothetical protein n=1 Tax=Nocardia spumae TaxID=2887190 RepID=UPI001D134E28|nr:hypothetical protein [Nocardia spumae]
MITLFIGCVILTIIIYITIVCWPQRIPPERRVTEIRHRIERENTDPADPHGDTYER